MISVKRCVFVTGASLETRRLYAPRIRQHDPFHLWVRWLGPLSSGLVLGLVLTLEFQKLWSLEDNFPRRCDRVLFVIWQAWWWCHFRKYSALRTQKNPQISVCRNVISLKSICVRIFSVENWGQTSRIPSSSSGFAATFGGHLWQLLYVQSPSVQQGPSFCLPPNTV